MMSKLAFQFRKNEYKKTYNILKNGFTKSIFKNTKKKSIFLNLKQTHPIYTLIFNEFGLSIVSCNRVIVQRNVQFRL